MQLFNDKPRDQSEEESGPNGTTYDEKKSPAVVVEPQSAAGADSDSDSFQDGVRRVRAITTVWTKYTLWSMFALYVHHPISLWFLFFFRPFVHSLFFGLVC